MMYTAETFGAPTKSIMDPVHGSIPIFSHEQKVIDTPLFQRLRHILQNDVLFLVFPGAKHNRLLHSIGTMHMASTVFTQLTSRHIANEKIEAVNEDQRRSIQYVHCCLRLAALLHDVGHFPFSHQFEECEPVAHFLKPALLTELWSNVGDGYWKEIYQVGTKKISHEDFSVRIAFEILSDNSILSGTGLNIEDVIYFLETAKNEPSEALKKHCENVIDISIPPMTGIEVKGKIITSFLKYLKSFISGELDADKMDYILRDSYFSGCRYGMYNKDHLINSLKVGFEPFRDKTSGKLFDVELSLAILEKGIGALEDFVYARYQLYLELYNHKTVSGFRKLLSLAIGEILSIVENEEEIKNILLDLQKFSHFTDTYFWEKFRRFAESKPNSACDRLINRRKLKYVEKRIDEEEEDIDLYCARYFHENGIRISYWKSRIKFSAISPKFKSIKVLVRIEYEPSKFRYELKKVSEITDFFTKFQRKDIFHLFEIPPELA